MAPRRERGGVPRGAAAEEKLRTGGESTNGPINWLAGRVRVLEGRVAELQQRAGDGSGAPLQVSDHGAKEETVEVASPAAPHSPLLFDVFDGDERHEMAVQTEEESMGSHAIHDAERILELICGAAQRQLAQELEDSVEAIDAGMKEFDACGIGPTLLEGISLCGKDDTDLGKDSFEIMEECQHLRDAAAQSAALYSDALANDLDDVEGVAIEVQSACRRTNDALLAFKKAVDDFAECDAECVIEGVADDDDPRAYIGPNYDPDKVRQLFEALDFEELVEIRELDRGVQVRRALAMLRARGIRELPLDSQLRGDPPKASHLVYEKSQGGKKSKRNKKRNRG